MLFLPADDGSRAPWKDGHQGPPDQPHTALPPLRAHSQGGLITLPENVGILNTF